MTEEWGPWIVHDGQGCPVPKGTLGEARLRNDRIIAFRAQCGSTNGGPDVPADPMNGSAWVWGSHPLLDRSNEVLAYRIRKPRGLSQLQEMIRDLEDEPA